MTYGNTTRTYKVEHSRVVVDTYLVEAENEEAAWFSWNEDPQAFTIIETNYINDIVEVVS